MEWINSAPVTGGLGALLLACAYFVFRWAHHLFDRPAEKRKTEGHP